MSKSTRHVKNENMPFQYLMNNRKVGVSRIPTKGNIECGLEYHRQPSAMKTVQEHTWASMSVPVSQAQPTVWKSECVIRYAILDRIISRV